MILTCQVNASPLAFSDSSSLDDRGKEFLHKRSIRGKSPRTTLTPILTNKLLLLLLTLTAIYVIFIIDVCRYLLQRMPESK